MSRRGHQMLGKISSRASRPEYNNLAANDVAAAARVWMNLIFRRG
jgi:hypothetical protein